MLASESSQRLGTLSKVTNFSWWRCSQMRNLSKVPLGSNQGRFKIRHETGIHQITPNKSCHLTRVVSTAGLFISSQALWHQAWRGEPLPNRCLHGEDWQRVLRSETLRTTYVQLSSPTWSLAWSYWIPGMYFVIFGNIQLIYVVGINLAFSLLWQEVRPWCHGSLNIMPSLC